MVQMQAAQFSKFGGPEVLDVVSVERPEPGPGEVLVRVDAAGINTHDTLVRAGKLRMQTGRRFPLGVGLDFAGEVVATGSTAGRGSGGKAAADPGPAPIPGDFMWGMVSPKKGHTTAAAAQFVVVPADRVAAAPPRLTPSEAASLVTPVVTAIQALRDLAAVKTGERVLVRGAAGGVGMVIVQLAHALGAHVTGLASSNDAEFVTHCGADEVLDYRNVSAADIGPFDVIIDTTGRGMLAFRRRLTRGGRMVTINFGSGPALAAIGISAVFGASRIRTFAAYPHTALLDDAAAFVQSGAINPRISTLYPLDRISEAHQAMAAPHSPGKLVLDIAH